MSERNILAYFKSPEEADQVSRKLESLRVVDMSINRFNAFHEKELDVASTANSGMSDEGLGETTGYDILLTVVTEDSSFDQAIRSIEEAGGRV